MRHTLLTLLVVLGPVALFQGLNFTGFCYHQGRFYSDEQLIDAAIRRNIEMQSMTPEPKKQYDSIEAFKRLNPDCCEVRRWGDPSLDPIWVRIFGFYRAMVDVWYRTNEEGGPDRFYWSLVSFDNCGRIVRTQGIVESHARIVPATRR
jgi:hypothetical protein